MSTRNASLSIPKDYVEEQLISGILRCSLEQYEGLLETLEDVDVRDRRRRTLLHLGVSLGKIDWVEGLLGEGADPSLRDGGEMSAVDMAEKMREMYPEDEDRMGILRLVRLANRRNNAPKHRRALLVGDVGASLTDFSRQTAELSTLKESIDFLKRELPDFGRPIAEEVKKLRKDLSDRDVLLRCLESAVTTSAEELRALKECLEMTAGAGNTRSSSLSIVDIRRQCVDSLMGRTTILNWDEVKVTRIRSLYEKLYNTSALTSCVLMFLKNQGNLSVMVDCDYNYIGHMKAILRDHDGVECRGSRWPSFADFAEHTVYLGWKVEEWNVEEHVLGWFAMALAQMANYLAFGNGGKPYGRADGIHEQEFKGALEETKGKRGVELDWSVRWALDKKTRLKKEIYFASVVPEVVARLGSTEGTSILREHVPSLLSFYEGHVKATLMNKARV